MKSTKPDISFNVVTLFPESCQCYTDTSMIKRAQKDGLIEINYFNPRDFTEDKHHRVDQKPYGGGPGMVIEAPSTLEAWKQAKGNKRKIKTIFFTPSGKKFDVEMAQQLAKAKHLIFLCGHYEGIDQRVVQATDAEEVSIGDFVLTGGELPALVMIDAITRFIPGVLGNETSLENLRVASPEVYTRPEKIKFGGKTYHVPDILLSGHHAEIEKWRHKVKSSKKKD